MHRPQPKTVSRQRTVMSVVFHFICGNSVSSYETDQMCDLCLQLSALYTVCIHMHTKKSFKIIDSQNEINDIFHETCHTVLNKIRNLAMAITSCVSSAHEVIGVPK